MRRTYTPNPCPEHSAAYREHIRWSYGEGHYVDLLLLAGRRVETPKGPGILEQVFRDRVGVTLDTEAGKAMDKVQMVFFRPEEIII